MDAFLENVENSAFDVRLGLGSKDIYRSNHMSSERLRKFVL